MSSYLIHYGTKGQKWGDRKYQYEDGSLTPEGKIHYGVGEGRKSSSKPSYDYKKKPYKSTTTTLIKPGQKKGVVKSAINQTKKDFKSDMKITKESKKSAFQKANEFFATPIGKAVLGIGVGAITTVTGSIIKNVVNDKMKSAKEIKTPFAAETKAVKVNYNPSTFSNAISTGKALYSAYDNLNVNNLFNSNDDNKKK